MECRVSIALGRTPTEVRAMSASDMNQMSRYWAEEPWGPYRDNLHAGMVAAAVMNASGRYKKPVRAEQFLIKVRDRAADGKRLLTALKMLATKKRKKRDGS